MNTPTQTDRAWAALRAQLDEAMPQRRRKRPFFFWFLLLAAAGLGAMMIQHKRTTPNHQAPTTEPVATADLRRDLEAAATPQTSVSAPEILENKSMLDQKASFAGPTTRPGQPGRPNNVLPLYTNDPLVHVQAASALSNAQDTTGAMVAPAPSPIFSTINTTLLRPIPTALVSLPQRNATLSVSSDLRLQPVQHDMPVKPDQANNRAWCLSVGGHIGWQETWKPDVGGLSAGVDWLPANGHFGARAALGYRLTHYRRTDPGNSVILNGFTNLDSSGLLDFEAVPTNIQSIPGVLDASIRNRHQLEMPIHLFWQPRKRFRVYAGGTVSYLLGVQGYEQVAYNNQQDVQLSSTRSLNRTLTRQEQRWQFAASAGVGYRIGKHLELTAMEQVVFLQQNKTAAANQLTTAAGVVDADAPVKTSFQVGVRWIW
jgi:hypothetical protein